MICIGRFRHIGAFGGIGVARFGDGRAGGCRGGTFGNLPWPVGRFGGIIFARFIHAARRVGIRFGIGARGLWCRGFGHHADLYALFQRHFAAQCLQKPGGRGGGQLHMGFIFQHADRTDFGFCDTACGAQHRQKPARFGILRPPDRQGQPDRGAEFGMHALWPFGGVAQLFGGGPAFTPQADKGGRDLVGVVGGEDTGHQRGLILGDRVQQRGQSQHAFIVARGDFIRRWGLGPGGIDRGGGQQALGLFTVGRGHDNGGYALVARAPGAARAVQQGFAVARQIGVDHQFQPRQVQATRGHIGGDTDPRAPIAHGLQGVGPFVLRKLAGQGDDSEAAVVEPRHQMVDGGAGGTEDQRVFRLIEPQHVDDGVFAVGAGHLQSAVFDIDMLAALACCGHPDRIALIALGQRGDGFGHGGRKHQGAPVLG